MFLFRFHHISPPTSFQSYWLPFPYWQYLLTLLTCLDPGFRPNPLAISQTHFHAPLHHSDIWNWASPRLKIKAIFLQLYARLDYTILVHDFNYQNMHNSPPPTYTAPLSSRMTCHFHFHVSSSHQTEYIQTQMVNFTFSWILWLMAEHRPNILKHFDTFIFFPQFISKSCWCSTQLCYKLLLFLLGNRSLIYSWINPVHCLCCTVQDL